MPLSRRRKKNGKTVGKGKASRRSSNFGDMESGVTLQSLINVLAAQEAQKPCKGVDTDICASVGCVNESCVAELRGFPEVDQDEKENDDVGQ